MAIDPPLHVPEDPAQRRRDRGHVLVLVGYVMIVADLILGAYFFAAMRSDGGQFVMIVLAVDLAVAIALIVVGTNIKQKAAGQ